MSTLITLSGGGTFELKGTNYLSVLAQGTPQENGTVVKEAYTIAQTMTPNGNALSATNRVVILLAPGLYSFDEASNGQFIVNTSFIDFESLSGERDVYFSSIEVLSSGTGLNVRLSGIDTTVNNYYPHGAFAVSTEGDASESIIVKNCKGNLYSFSSFSSGLNGTYESCEGGDFSFGNTGDSIVPPSGINGIPTAFLGFSNFGTFKNCIGGFISFCASTLNGVVVRNNGTIDNCQAQDNSFCSSENANAENNGIIKNCTGMDLCFAALKNGGMGTQALNTGSILNCVSNSYSFVMNAGTFNTSSAAVNVGTIYNCFAIEGSFVVNPFFSVGGNAGLILNCNSTGSDSFMGSNGENYDLVSNCTAVSNSFCSNNPLGIVEDMLRCTLSNGTFTVGATGGGRVVLGIDNTGVVNY
jgi:hypothetical protein